jgi:hypothetical protein
VFNSLSLESFQFLCLTGGPHLYPFWSIQYYCLFSPILGDSTKINEHRSIQAVKLLLTIVTVMVQNTTERVERQATFEKLFKTNRLYVFNSLRTFSSLLCYHKIWTEFTNFCVSQSQDYRRGPHLYCLFWNQFYENYPLNHLKTL